MIENDIESRVVNSLFKDANSWAKPCVMRNVDGVSWKIKAARFSTIPSLY